MVFPEPITILSTSAGILGFLVGSVEKTVETVDNVARCRNRLSVSCFRLDRCYGRLERWHTKWGLGAEVSRNKTELWGERGARMIEHYFEQIKAEAISLRQHLYGDFLTWNILHVHRKRDLAKALDRKQLPNQPKITKVIGRLTYALYEKKLLDNSLDRLESLLDLLENESEGMHDDEHGTNNGNRDDLISLRNSLGKLTSSMERAWHTRPDPAGIWALFIAPSREFIEDKDPDEFQIPFFYASRTLGTQLTGRRMDVLYHPGREDLDEVSTCLNHTFSHPNEGDKPFVINNTLSIDFKFAHALEVDERRAMRKVWEFARATTALSLATWVALMWGTPWTRDICSCQILEIRLENEEIEPRPAALASIHLFGNGDCSLRSLTQHPYLLLGVVLTEIALMQCIRVRVSAERFEISMQSDTSLHRVLLDQEHAADPDRISVDVPALLKLVEHNSSQPYRTAVAHCFELGNRRRLKGLQPSKFTANDFTNYKRKVLDNLRTHYTRSKRSKEDNARAQLLIDLRQDLMSRITDLQQVIDRLPTVLQHLPESTEPNDQQTAPTSVEQDQIVST